MQKVYRQHTGEYKLTFSEQYKKYLEQVNKSTKFGQAVPYTPGTKGTQNVVGFWKEAQEKIAEGYRLRFPEVPKTINKNPIHWSTVRLPTAEDKWVEGMKGITLPGAEGRTYEEFNTELELARHPGAKEILPSGVPWYGGKTEVEDRILRVQSLLKYGEREIDDITLDSDTQLEFDNASNIAQRMGIALKAYQGKAQDMADEQDEKATHKAYEWIFDNVGKYYHTARQKVADLVEANLAYGYYEFSGDQNFRDAWDAADKELANKVTNYNRRVYNPVAQLTGASMYADLAENVFWQWLPWNWGKADSVQSLGDTQKSLTWLKEHPGVSEAVAKSTLVNEYWSSMAEEWLNPFDWAVDKAFDIVFPLTVGRLANRALHSMFPRIARRAAKVTPEIAKVVSNYDEAARLGGISDEAYYALKNEGLVEAIQKDVTGTIEGLTKWADEYGIFTHTNETKAALTSEDVQMGVRWVVESLGHDGDPARFYHRLETVSKLASEDKTVVDAAFRELSRIPNFDFWFSQTGQTTAYILNKAFDVLDEQELLKLYKEIDDIPETSKKIATLMAWVDNKAIETTSAMFPTLEEAVRAGRVLPKHLDAARKVDNQIMKAIGPVQQWFSNWYLGKTPGYAVRNGLQNFGQTIFDLGIGSVDGYKHVDDAFNWAGADELLEAGEDLAKTYGDLFIGMERDLSGITGPLGKKFTGQSKWDMRFWSNEAEKFGGRVIFGHMYPKEVKKMLQGNLSKQFMKLGADKQTARMFEEAIISNQGNITKARKYVEDIVSNGFWRDASLRNLPVGLQKKAQAYRYDTKIFEWLADSGDDFEAFAKHIDDFTDELIDGAEQTVRLEGATAPAAGVSVNPGHVANSVAFDGQSQKVANSYNSIRAANQEANRKVGEALETMRREIVHGLVSTGMSEDEARIVYQRWLHEVDLTVDGEKAAAVGKIDGYEYMERRVFSPSEEGNPRLWKQQNEIGNRHADRVEEIRKMQDEPGTIRQQIEEFWNKHLAEDFGEYAGQDYRELKRAEFHSFLLEDRAWWNDWSDQNYNMARRIADGVLPKAADAGVNIAPSEHLFSEANKAFDRARDYQKWLPEEMIQHSLYIARKNQDEGRRLFTFATEYARRYGVETTFIKDGKEFLNHQKLVSIINKQLGTDFKHLNAMSGLKESQIREAMRHHSLGLYMNIVDDPESAVNLIMRVIDPGKYGNKSIVERLTSNELKDLRRFSDLVGTADSNLAVEFNNAISARNAIPDVATAANQDAYNELARLRKEADDNLVEVGDRVMELLGARKVAAESRKFESVSKRILELSDQEIGEYIAMAPQDKFDELLDWLKNEDEDLWRSFGRQAASRRTVGAEQIEDVRKYYDPSSYDESLDENLRNLVERIREQDAALAPEARRVARLIEQDSNDTYEWVNNAAESSQVDVSDFVHLWGGEDAPTASRVVYESRDEIRDFAEDLKSGFRAQWDNVVRMTPEDAATKLDNWYKMEDTGKGMVSQARLGAMQTVKEQRDFILHNYQNRRNFDTLLAYIYPYHFWHTRNAVRWGQRIARKPGIARAYTRYKDRMARINADQPEWFRNNVRITGALGFDDDNPLLINLEALLNPAYQVLKTPFYDPDKRDTAFARMLDDAGRVMSVHTIYQILYGLGRYAQGDKEQGAAWMSRLIPQTKVISAATSVAANTFGIDKWKRGIELDPIIGIQGAIEAGDISGYFSAFDPYEQKRVALGYQALVNRGEYTEEEVIDAIMSGDRENPITVAAHGIAQSQKNMGDLLSFVGGPGFQIRSKDERQIMAMDEEFRALFEGQEFLDADETAQLWQVMRNKYPQYFNTVMLTRKDRDTREKSFVYNVMSRIPPGQTSQIYDAVGINYDDVSEFYDSKGESLKTMPEADRQKFMAGIYELSTVAAFPDDATRNEWNEVKRRYGLMKDELEKRYGEEVFAARDYFFKLLKEDSDKAYQFLDANPDVGYLMSDETQWKFSDALMSKYYASYDNARSMLNAEMYDRLDAQFPNGRQMNDEYWAARNAGQKVKPSEELKDYWAQKNAIEEIYGAKLVSYGRHLENVDVEMPKRFDPNEAPEGLSRGAQSVSDMELNKANVPPQYRWSWDQWERVMDPTTARLVQDWAFRGAELPDSAYESLSYLLEGMNIDPDEALYLMQQASQGAGAQYYSPENPPWWTETGQ